MYSKSSMLPFTRIFLKRFSSLPSSNRPDCKVQVPDGCLFAPLLRATDATHSHPLDNAEGYLKFLREELPSQFDDLTTPSVLGYNRRAKELLKHTLPPIHPCWTFGVELMSHFIAPKEQMSQEDLKKIRLIRGCIDVCIAGTAVVDDIIELSDVRMNKPSWRKVCPEGESVALYDGIILGLLPYHIMKKHFRKTPGYHLMLEAYQRLSVETTMGFSLEVMGHKRPDTWSRNVLQEVLHFKTACFFGCQPTFGMLLAGIMDENLIAQVEKIFYKTGTMIQCWNDFCDYYCTAEQNKTPSSDVRNAIPSWCSVTAMELFSNEQKRIFHECFGSADLDKVDVVYHLFDSVDLPTQYANYIKSQAQHCSVLIANLRHEGCRNACTSWLKWLVGDIREN